MPEFWGQFVDQSFIDFVTSQFSGGSVPKLQLLFEKFYSHFKKLKWLKSEILKRGCNFGLGCSQTPDFNRIRKLEQIKCIRGHWHGVVPLLGGEPCVSHDQLKADDMLEHKIGSTVWNKEFRLKYKHARRDEMKKVLKDERQKARKEDGRNKVFNERLGVHIFSDQEGRFFIKNFRTRNF